MDHVSPSSSPVVLVARGLTNGKVEIHLESGAEAYSLVPYIHIRYSEGTRVKKAQLQGIPSSVTFDQLKQAAQVLQQAIIRCRAYLNDPVVEVFPRGLGGMKRIQLLKQASKPSSTVKPQHKPKDSSSDLPPLIDEEEAKPSNRNTVAPLKQIPLPSIEEVLQQLETFAIPLETGGRTLLDLGVESYERGDLRSALPLWQQALVLARFLEDRKLEGITCGNLGIVYTNLGEYRHAIEFREKHLAIAKELEDHAGERSAYSGLGYACDGLGEYRRAIAYHEKDLAFARELEDRAGEGSAYSGLGNAYESLGKYRRAIDCHEKHLAIAKELEDRVGEGIAHGNLGNAYESLGEYHLAIDYHEKTLAIAKELEDRDIEGRAYGNLGKAYRSLGEYRRAIAYHEKFLALARDLKDRNLEGKACTGLGNAYWSLGEYRRAIAYHEKCLAIAKELEDRNGEGRAYSGLGNAAERLGEYRRAIAYHEEFLAIANELEDRDGEGRVYSGLGNAYQSLGEYRRAIEYHEKHLAIAKELEDRVGEGIAHGNLGLAYHSLGESRRAIDYHEKDLAIAKELEDRDGEGRAYGNLGLAYQSLGECRRAIDYHEKHLAIAKELEDRAGEGRACGHLGLSYSRLREYQRGIGYLEKHLAIAKAMENRAEEGSAHNNLGVTYRKEGNLLSSESHFRQAVACHSVLQEDLGAENQSWQISIFEEQARAYLQLKDVLVAQGKRDEALALADFGRSRALSSFLSHNRLIAAKKPFSVKEIQALAIRHKTTFLQYSFDHSDRKTLYAWTVSPSGEIAFHQLSADRLTSTKVSDSLSALAPIGVREACLTGLESLANLTMTRDEAIDSGFGGYDLGESSCDELSRESSSSLPASYKKILEEGQTPETKLSALLHLTHLCQIRGQWDSLTEIALKLESLAQGLNDSTPHQSALIHLAFAYNALGNGGEALPYAEAASALALESGDKGSEGKALREQALAYHLIGQKEKAVPLAKEALALAQETHDLEGEGVAYRVLGTLALEGCGTPSSSDDANNNSPSQGSYSKQSLPHPLECFYKALTVVIGPANVDPAEEMRKLCGLAKAYEQADQLGEALPCYNQALKIAKSLNLTQDMGEISAARSRLTPLLREQTHRLLSEYYQVLIAPLEQYLTPDSRITLVPDSALHSLPFAIFKDSEGKYLIEKYTLSMVPSMEVLQELDLMEGKAPPTQPALIVGDPQENLAFSAWEARKLGELFKTPPLIGSKATPSAVVQQAKEARFLHLTCHGNASFRTHPNSVFEGALALANEETKRRWWSAEEIQKLPLKAELAFLSACKSGRGKLQKEGVIGLTRSFLAAGVPTVIATHWSIPDSECTVKIAQAFYSHILRKTREAQAFEGELGKDEILRQVLLDLIDEDPELRDHPEKWGAFFLLGLP